MKIIVSNESKVAYYVFDDSYELIVEETRTTTPNFIIGDMGSANSTVYENITDVPEDWENDKYIYDDSAEPKWSLVPVEEEVVEEVVEEVAEAPVEETPVDEVAVEEPAPE